MNDDSTFPSTPGDSEYSPSPEPRFVRKLRVDLMTQAYHLAEASSGSKTRTATQRAHHRSHWDRSLTVQVALTGLLLVALIGSLASGYRNSGPNGAVIPAPQEESISVSTYRENAARTGISYGTGPQSTPELAWSQDLLGQQLRSTLVADGTLYAVVRNNLGDPVEEVQARALETGELLWSFGLDEVAGPALLVVDDTIYVSSPGESEGGGSGYLTALDARSGIELWKTKTPGTNYSAPLYADHHVYLLASDNSFRAIDAKSGNEDWSLDLRVLSEIALAGTPFPEQYAGLQTDFSPAAAGGLAYVTAGDGILYAIDLDSHQMKWSFRTRGNTIATPTIVEDAIYVPACYWKNPDEPENPEKEQCSLIKLDAKTGDELIRITSDEGIALHAASPEFVVISSDQHTVLLSPDTLEEIAVLPDGQYEPTVTANTIFQTDASGTIYAYEIGRTQEEILLLWSAYPGRSFPGTVTIAGELLITSGPALPDFGEKLVALIGTRGGTPVPGDEPIDLSGQPACVLPPSVDWESLTGEPAHTITNQVGKLTSSGAESTEPPTADEKRAGYSSAMEPWMDFDAVPTGEAVSSDVREGIRSTIDAIAACLARNDRRDASGFFSEDFFRREHIRFVLTDLGYESQWFTGGLFTQFLQESSDYRLLPDGRVAILADPANEQIVSNFAMFVVFVQVDGRWVVDESIRVGIGALQG